MKPVLIIMMGGTIDAEAYPDPAHPPVNATMLPESCIPEAVAALKRADKCEFLPWIRKDSKFFLESDIHALAGLIQKQVKQRNVIITCGTDMMARNARELARTLGMIDKCIIFTGAMIPLANGIHSDGYANLRFAIDHVAHMELGVHVVMHQKIYGLRGLRKNMLEKKFFNQPTDLQGDAAEDQSLFNYFRLLLDREKSHEKSTS